MADDQHVALPLQFHDDRLQTLNEVLVGLNKKKRDFQIITQKIESSVVCFFWPLLMGSQETVAVNKSIFGPPLGL